MKHRILLAVTASLCVLAIPESSAGEVILHEGGSGSQDVVCRIPVPDNRGYRFHNFKKDNLSCENDEARSFTLVDIPANTVLQFYDSPKRRTNDDWVRIRTRQAIRRMVIGTFELDRDRPEIEIEYSPKNGLDGKVSSVEINPSEDCRRAGTPVLDREGDRIIARVSLGPTNCPWDGRLELQIRQDRPWRSDKRLARTTTPNPNNPRELGVSWPCRVTPYDQEIKIFAEFRFRGKKYRQSGRQRVNCRP